MEDDLCLDRNRPYSIVSSTTGRLFEQDGVLFTAAGKPVNAGSLALAGWKLSEKRRQADLVSKLGKRRAGLQKGGRNALIG